MVAWDMSMVYDSVRHVVVLFGGSYYTLSGGVYTYVQSNQTWLWNGSTWTQAHPVTSPPARAGAFMSFDASVGKSVLFGGRNAAWAAMSDTWTWDGSNWTQESPAVSPPARAYGAMVYDSALATSVLYGGATGYQVLPWLADVWAWSSSAHTWTLLETTAAPGSRVDMQLGYDPVRNQVVLFGGTLQSCTSTCTSTVEGDTWTFNGTTWTAYFPATAPSPRVLYRVAYDPVAGGVVLFGGETNDPGTLFNDTWRWNGASWDHAVGVASPPGRELFGMAYDAASGQMVVVGGDGPLTLPTDTWEYDWSAPTLTEVSSATTVGTGESIQYTVTVGNAAPSGSMTSSLTETLPLGLSPGPVFLPVITDGSGANLPCATVGCSFATNGAGVTTLLLGALVLVAGDVITIVYDVLSVVAQATCSLLAHLGQAANGTLKGATVSLNADLCGAGLGLESWMSYATSDLGSGGTASVNVANGNLVVQQQDSTPVQGHGRIGYVLRRTYNSEDTTLIAGPASVGLGWQLNIAQTDDLATGGASPLGLSVPSLLSLLNPLAVTLVDRDGTRQMFTWNGYKGALVSPPATAASPALLGDLKSLAAAPPAQVALVATLCLGTGYVPPPGVDMDMWSYVGVSGPSCGNPGSTMVPLGFSVERSDRVHYDFAASGQTVDMVDGSGNVQLYGYVTGNPLQLKSITEPSCTAGATCRAITIVHGTDETDVTDTAGRLTRYLTDTSGRLTKVVNPDQSTELYGYGGCGGTANQLCTATDPRGDVTHFNYGGNVIPVLPGPIVTTVDRRGTTDLFYYGTIGGVAATAVITFPSTVTCSSFPAKCQQSLYSNIDAFARVGDTYQGTQASGGTYVTHTTDTWDSFGTHGTGVGKQVCTVPAPPLPVTLVDGLPVDNVLCAEVVHAIGGEAPDHTTTSTYGTQGQRLTQVRTVATGQSVTTTWGYHVQYVETGTPVACDYAPQGGGTVSTTAGCTTAPDSSTLFALSDRTAMLTPRGNSPSPLGGFAKYETTDVVDDTVGLPNLIQAASCGTAAAANTGSLCEVDAPATNGTALSPGGSGSTVTRYSYDGHGQKVSMTSPKSVAEDGGAATTTYSYYSDADTDLSGLVSAGGWLKTVTDPTGSFVAFAYDRAGNQVRSWDRDATVGHHQTDTGWNSVGGSPSTIFTENLYGPYPGAPTGSSAYSAPWRWQLSHRDPLGNLTSYTVDANGNRTSIRPPRGNQAGNNSHDTIQGFDAADTVVWALQPVQAGPSGPPPPPTVVNPPPPGGSTVYVYDGYGNRSAETDPLGDVQTWTYDGADRQIVHAWTRGPSSMLFPPAGCRASTSADLPIPPSKLMCVTETIYNGVGDIIDTVDGNAQVSGYVFDGLGRKVGQVVPRTASPLTYVTTVWNYDADGNTLDSCPPNEFTPAGANACTATGIFSTHVAYNAAELPVTTTTYRQAGTAEVTTTGYDADADANSVTDANGHTTTTIYNLLDRKTEVDTPRDAAHTNVATWTYDASGNTITMVEPPGTGNVVHQSAYSFDADNRPVDTVVGADNPVAATAGLPDSAGTVNERTRTVYDADGNAIVTFDARAFLPYGTPPVADPKATPNPDDATTVGYDLDDRPLTSATPRYDTADPTVAPEGSDATQALQCPTGVPGPAGYQSTTGVCTTTAHYDNAGRVIEIDPPTVASAPNRYVTYSYTDDGLVSAVGAPDPSHDGARVTATSMSYDGDGKTVLTAAALVQPVVTLYTPDELVSQVLGPYYTDGTTNVDHQTFNSYDANANLTKTVDGVGQTTTTTYTADNLTAATCQSLTLNTSCNLVGTPHVDGLQTAYSYDADGNPTQVTSPSASVKDATNPSGTPTVNTYSYDNLLDTTAVPVAGDGSTLQATTYSYDPGGRKISQATALTTAGGTVIKDGGAQSFTYAPDDAPVQQTGRTGETITTSYNPTGQPTGYLDQGGSAVADVIAGYYLDGTLRSVDDTGGITNGRTTSYDYDGLGDPTTLIEASDGGTPPTSHTTTYSYGDAAQPETITSDLTGSTPWTLGYDQDGRQTSQTDPSGQTVATGYYPDNTVATQSTQSATGTVAAWTYHYDSDGRIKTQTLANAAGVGTVTVAGTYSYGYDPAGRVNTFTDQTGSRAVTFDHNNNRLTYGTQTFTYNANDTINTGPAGTSNTTATYSYDGAGRLTYDGCNTDTYDGFDRTASITGTNNGCTGATAYTYDGVGRQRNTGPSDIHYDGLSQTVIAEAPKNTNTDNAYILTPAATPVATVTAGLAASYLTTDGHNNITTITNGLQAVTCEARFDPFGTPENVGTADKTAQNTCNTGTTTNTAFYQTARHDSTTGTYQFGNRTYNPATSNFLTGDTPTGPTSAAALSVGTDPLTANTYTYVNGDPINYNDPNGHMPVFPGDGSGPVVIPTLAQTNTILQQQVQTQEANRAVDGGDIPGRDYIQSDSIIPSANYNEVITTTNNKMFVLTNAPSNEEEWYILSRLRAQFGDTYEFAAVLRSKIRTPDFVAIDRETGQVVRIDTTRIGEFTAPGTTTGRIDEKGGYDPKTGQVEPDKVQADVVVLDTRDAGFVDGPSLGNVISGMKSTTGVLAFDGEDVGGFTTQYALPSGFDLYTPTVFVQVPLPGGWTVSVGLKVSPNQFKESGGAQIGEAAADEGSSATAAEAQLEIQAAEDSGFDG
jgi:RHS repeat-associated protein